MFEPRSNIPSLTGIRGVAAFLVLLFHLPIAHIFSLSGALPIIRNGNLGVDLFFILSGFILMHTHAKDLDKPGLERVKSFYVSRIIRVYPVHFAVLMAILAFVLACPGYADWFRTLPRQENAYSFWGFWQTLTLTNSVGLPDLGSWNAPSWSLSAEMVGYAAFPTLALYANKFKSRKTCSVSVLILLTCYVIARKVGLPGENLLRMALCFSAGLCLARAYHLRPGAGGAAALSLVSTAVAVVSLAIDQLVVYSVFGFAGLIYALALGGGAIDRFLSSPSILFLGKISYSLYLSHFVVQTGMLWAFWQGDGTTTAPFLTACLLIAVPLLIGTFIYYLVEKPAHALGRKYARSRRNRVRRSNEAGEPL